MCFIPFLLKLIRLLTPLFPRFSAWLATLLFCWTGHKKKLDFKKIPNQFISQKIAYGRHQLQLYIATPSSPKETLIVSHGWMGHPMQFKRMALKLYEEGYRVVLFDQHAHGYSTGHFSSISDFSLALETVCHAYPDVKTVICHSFGGLAAMWSYSQRQLHVTKIISIGAPESTEKLAKNFTHSRNISPTLIPYMNTILKKHNKYDYLLINSSVYGPLIDIPVHIFHDEEDDAVSLDAAKKIASNIPNAELIVTSHLGHKKILSDANVILQILERL